LPTPIARISSRTFSFPKAAHGLERNEHVNPTQQRIKRKYLDRLNRYYLVPLLMKIRVQPNFRSLH
jgi:hypothetical protein